MRPLRAGLLAGALALGGCGLTTQQVTDVTKVTEEVACVIAEAAIPGQTEALVAQICAIPLDQVVAILAAQKAAQEHAEKRVQCGY